MLILCQAGASWAGQSDRVAGPRDQLTVTVFNEPTLSGKYTVELDGTFEFPLVGRVKASGLTVRDIEAELGRELANGYLKNPQVTVGIELNPDQRIFVMGEVRTPGPYQFGGDITLLEALARAGSVSAGAASEVLVIRPTRGQPVAGPVLPPDKGDSEVIRVSLKDLQSGELARSNIMLHDGDTVFVARAQLVYMTGQVKAPGAYTIASGTTVLQALALAGGVSERGSASRIKIIRTVAGKKKEFKVKLTDPVEPGDTIVVPTRYF